MKEAEIKTLMRNRLSKRGNLCVEELPICGHAARADLVEINLSLIGFEIKSASDSLSRLSTQCKIYDRVFQFSTLVVANCHLAKARKLVPENWGIIKIRPDSNVLVEVRKAKTNKRICSKSIAEFFWQQELVEILRSLDSIELKKSWTRKRLREEAARTHAPQDLLEIAASKMRARRRWRAA